MSYILDALKKSEEARGPRKTRGLLNVPIKTSQPPKQSSLRPYIIALILVLNAGFFVLWLHPWQGGGNMGSSSSRIKGGPFPETRSEATPATQPELIKQAVDKQGSAQSQPEAAPNLAASDGAKAVPQVAEGEKEAERNRPENAGQTANPVESSNVAAVSPPASGTQNSHETTQDQVVETKIPPKAPSAMQGPKTAPVPAEPAPVKLPSTPSGASKTNAAVAKKPTSPKMQQNAKDAATKQGIKTAKSENAWKNPPVQVEQPFQPRAGGGIVSDLQDLPKPAERKEPKWHELAPQVRDALPGMSVSMLVYSRNPEERWININGTKRREGQEISSGLKLEEITPDGAVFSYQGQRFYKGVVGN